MDEKFFTLDEVSKYLKIPKSTLYKLSQQGKIPSVKIGKQLRFRKSSLDHWFNGKEEQKQRQKQKQLAEDQPEKDILLIDDDPLVLKAMAKFLKRSGYQIESTESGEEALEKVQKSSFDLIISDVRMPGIDGIETIKKIREFNRNAQRKPIPEIIITGYADSTAEAEAERLGIKDYLYKPFAIADFLKRVEKNINN